MAYCKKCGFKLDLDDEYCFNCGAPVKITDDVESKKDLTVTTEIKESVQSKQTTPKSKKTRVPLIIGISAVILALIGGGIFAIVSNVGKTKTPAVNNDDYIDANKYFEENGSIEAVTPINKSKRGLSEKEVTVYLKDRGFSDYPITTEYSENGGFIEITEISENSNKKHPVYETYFVSSKNETWAISVIDGTIIAFPSSYNLKHSDSIAVVVSETNTVVSYDVATNTFFTTTPKDSVLKVRAVEKIDAKTLESIDLEG